MNTSAPKQNLLIISQTYPWGKGEAFLEVEITYLLKVFDRIFLLPYSQDNWQTRRTLPERVILLEQMRPANLPVWQLIKRGLFNFTSIAQFLGELWTDKRIFISWTNFEKWLRGVLTIRMVISHYRLLKVVKREQIKIVYFYWGTPISGLALFLRRAGAESVVRLHGGDLYSERAENRHYLPFRRILMRNVTVVLIVSKHGKKYLSSKYPSWAAKYKLARIGVGYEGTNQPSGDHILRTVTCSSLTPVKRLDLLIAALKFLKVPVEWTHIGDGPLKEELLADLKTIPDNLKVRFLGQLNREDLFEYYRTFPVDLFLNVSISEGVPVSIMEALSFSIPVIATAVGGTAELVDDKVGKLIAANINAVGLAATITWFYNLPYKTKMQLRRNAFLRWQTRANAIVEFGKLQNLFRELGARTEEC